MSEEKEEGKKDIKALVAVIPPADVLKRREAKAREKRIRLRYREGMPPDKAAVNPTTAQQLGIEDKLEIVVAGRHKFTFTAVLDEEVPPNEIWCNPELLRDEGIADNSIATVRRAMG
jgi:anaerobic selenocysteine-containing dehydrogenase